MPRNARGCPKTRQSPHAVSTNPARVTCRAVFSTDVNNLHRAGFGKRIAHWNADRVAQRLTAVADTKGKETVRRLSFSILLIVTAFVLGLSSMAAQDAPQQAHAPEGPARGALDRDQQLALMRQDIQSIRKKLIGDNLNLTVTEAAKFWPVYEEYATDFGKIDEDRSLIVKEYSDSFGCVTDEQADNLIRRWLDTDISAAKLRQKYVPIVRMVLPAKKAATFFQIDRRVSMMIDVQITSQIPLVQDQADASAGEDHQLPRSTDFQD
jgi:hypothetical protein